MRIAAAEAALSDFLAQCDATGLWHRRHHSLITALSGGADSLALVLIAERVSTAQNIPHKALIIDHGLRQASAVEAATVQTQMRERGITAEILTINSPQTGSWTSGMGTPSPFGYAGHTRPAQTGLCPVWPSWRGSARNHCHASGTRVGLARAGRHCPASFLQRRLICPSLFIL